MLDPSQRADWATQPAQQRREWLKSLVQRIDIAETEVLITIKNEAHGENTSDDYCVGSEVSTITVPFVVQKRGGQKQIHLPHGKEEATWVVNAAVTAAMIRAWKWRQWFERGEVSSITEAAKREKCTEAYVRKILPMAFLAPDVIEAAIAGTLPRHLKITDLAHQDMPLNWAAQRRQLGMVP